MSIVEAASVRVSTLSDGTLRLTVDIEPRNAQAAFTLFGSPGTAVALAALVPVSEPAPEPAKPEAKAQVGPICHWLALRCKEKSFRLWLQDAGDFVDALDEAAAANVVRDWCGVLSRKDIDGNADAERKFQKHIRSGYSKWCIAAGIST